MADDIPELTPLAESVSTPRGWQQTEDSPWVPNRPVPAAEPPAGVLRRRNEDIPELSPLTPKDERRGWQWSDVSRSFVGSAVQTASDAVAAGEYLAGSGGTLTDWRERTGKTADSYTESTSPAFKASAGKEFTSLPSWLGGGDNSAWEGFGTMLGASAATAISTTGSLTAAVPAIVAGALAGPYAIPAAAVVAGATGVVLGAGTVWGEVAKNFSEMDEKDRLKNPTYKRLRDEGVEQPQAIDQTVREAASGYVEFAGAASGLINAATGGFLGKVGGKVAGALGRGAAPEAGAGAAHGVGKGVLAGVRHGVVAEGPTEFGEEGTQDAAKQGIMGNLTGAAYSIKQTAEAAIKGAIGGAGLGGATGGFAGALPDRRPGAPGAPPVVDPGVDAAINGTPPATPPAAPTGPETPPMPGTPPAAPGTPPTAPAPPAPIVDPGIAAAAAASNPPVPGAPSTPTVGGEVDRAGLWTAYSKGEGTLVDDPAVEAARNIEEQRGTKLDNEDFNVFLGDWTRQTSDAGRFSVLMEWATKGKGEPASTADKGVANATPANGAVPGGLPVPGAAPAVPAGAAGGPVVAAPAAPGPVVPPAPLAPTGAAPGVAATIPAAPAESAPAADRIPPDGTLKSGINGMTTDDLLARVEAVIARTSAKHLHPGAMNYLQALEAYVDKPGGITRAAFDALAARTQAWRDSAPAAPAVNEPATEAAPVTTVPPPSSGSSNTPAAVNEPATPESPAESQPPAPAADIAPVAAPPAAPAARPVYDKARALMTKHGITDEMLPEQGTGTKGAVTYADVAKIVKARAPAPAAPAAPAATPPQPTAATAAKAAPAAESKPDSTPAPESKPKITPNAVRDASRLAEEELLSKMKTRAEQLFGDSDGITQGQVAAIVKSAVAEVTASIVPEGRSVVQLVRAIRDQAATIAEASLTEAHTKFEAQEAARVEAAEKKNKAGPKPSETAPAADQNVRIEQKNIADAAKGDETQIQRIGYQFSKQDGRHRARFVARMVAGVREAGVDPASLPWVTAMQRSVVAGSNLAKATAAGEARKAAETQSAAITEARQERQTTVVDAFKATAPSYANRASMTVAQAVEGFKKVYESALASIGAKSRTDALRLLNDPKGETDAASILKIMEEATKITSGENAAEMVTVYQGAEAVMRSGDIDFAVDSVAQAKEEAAASRGTMGSESNQDIADDAEVEDTREAQAQGERSDATDTQGITQTMVEMSRDSNALDAAAAIIAIDDANTVVHDISTAEEKADAEFLAQRAAEKAAAREAASAAMAAEEARAAAVPKTEGRKTLTINRIEKSEKLPTRRGFLGGLLGTATYFAAGRAFGSTKSAVDSARQGDLSSTIRAIASSSANPAHRALAAKLLPMLGNVRLRIIETGKAYDEKFPASLRSAYGVTTWNRAKGETTIYLRDDSDPNAASGMNDETILHEAIHAALMSRFGPLSDLLDARGKLIDPNHPAAEHIVALRDLKSAMVKYTQRDKAAMKERDESSFLSEMTGDLDEFVAYALTDAKLQTWMKGQELNNQSYWRRFISAVKGILGLDSKATYLDAVTHASNSLFDVGAVTAPLNRVMETERGPGLTDRKQRDGTTSTDTDFDEDGMISKMLKIPDSISEFRISESALAGVWDRTKTLSLGMSSLTQLGWYARELFTGSGEAKWVDPGGNPNPFLRVVHAVLQRSALAAERAKAFIEPMQLLNALPAAKQQPLIDLLFDASEANVNPHAEITTDGINKHLAQKGVANVQARQRHATLRRAYLAMDAESRLAYDKIVAVFKNAHSLTIHSLTDNAIDRWWQKKVTANYQAHEADPSKKLLPVEKPSQVTDFLAKLKKAAYEGKLTEDEKMLLGDDVYALVVDARQRAVMQGVYIPHQRYGDYVVSWKETAPAQMLFNTREAMEEHARQSNYRAVGEREIHYDKDGKEITTADETIRAEEVGKLTAALAPDASLAERKAAMRKGIKNAKKLTIARDSVRSAHELTQQTQGMAMFETIGEQRAFARKLVEQGITPNALDRRATPAEAIALLGDKQINDLVKAIRDDKSISEEVRGQAAQSLAQAAMLIVPNRALNSTLVKRRNVIGPNRDLGRVMANYGVAVANFSAGVDTGLLINTGLAELGRQRDAGRRAAGGVRGAHTDDSTMRRAGYIREVEKRVLTPPTDTAGGGSSMPWVRRLQSMTFVHFLMSPSYNLIQMTQPWMMTAPILAAKHGLGASTAALTRAMRDIGVGGVLAGGFADTASAMKAFVTDSEAKLSPIVEQVTARLARQQDGANLVRMLDTLAGEDFISRDAGLELTRSEISNDALAWRSLGKLEGIARAMPAAIEVINRASSAVAAYRLAVKAGMNHDQAVQAARDVVDQSQGHYGAANTARFMDARRNPLLGPAFTFRKYAQAMYGLLVRQVWLSVKGESKEVRFEAMRTLAYVLGAHIAIAGTLGLPTEAITIVLGVVALLSGESEPWDWEAEVRRMLAKAVGPQAAEAIAMGLPRLLGVDVHGRMGLNSLLFINDLHTFEKKSLMEYAGNLLTGAPGSMVTGWATAIPMLMKGDIGKAAELGLPKGLRDPIKAMRFNTDGVTTKRGERIDMGNQMGMSEVAMQALGFAPATVSETYERRNAVQSANRTLTTERTALIHEWRSAKPSERQGVWEDIQTFNRELPREAGKEVKITRAGLIASEREMKRRTKKSGSGDYLPKGREYLRERGSFANVR